MLEDKTLHFKQAEVSITFGKDSNQQPKISIADKETGILILVNFPPPKPIHSLGRRKALRAAKPEVSIVDIVP